MIMLGIGAALAVISIILMFCVAIYNIKKSFTQDTSDEEARRRRLISLVMGSCGLISVGSFIVLWHGLYPHIKPFV